MEIAEFIDRFRPRITVGVDWARLRRLSLSVETRLISSHDELAALGLPWYVDAVGASCDYDIPGARRLRVGEAVGLIDGALSDRRAGMEEKTKELESSKGLVLPAYSRGGSPILLDGCHRSLALMKAPGNPEIELFTVTGPDDPSLLLDLTVAD